MTAEDDANAKVIAAYNAAADTYDDPANSFWDRFGRATTERLRLPLGSRVLDVCCGSGASAIPAAQCVGPDGFVLGLDIAEKLLAMARAKASVRGLSNVEFRTGSLMNLRVADAQFDAVVCVFGIFFAPDMSAAARELWRAVRPGGRLAITTWGPNFFEPGTTAFWNAVRVVRPNLYKRFNPWDRISDPQSLHALLDDAGIADAEVIADSGTHPIPSPEAWWSAVLGSGYRGTLEQLDPSARERVRSENLRFIQESNIRSVEANVVYAVARKDAVETSKRLRDDPHL